MIRHQDTPGVIGHLGTVLGKAGINIGRMQLGLRPKGGEAVSLVSIGQSAPEAVLEQLTTGDVLAVRQVSL